MPPVQKSQSIDYLDNYPGRTTFLGAGFRAAQLGE